MDKEKQKDFARRVTQANKTELVSITCDIIIENIECASGFLGKGNTSEYRTELKQAQNFLGELIRSLDFKYPIFFVFRAFFAVILAFSRIPCRSVFGILDMVSLHS